MSERITDMYARVEAERNALAERLKESREHQREYARVVGNLEVVVARERERTAALTEALTVAAGLLREEGYDIDYAYEWFTIESALAASSSAGPACICYPGHHDMPGGREPACPAP